jgi:hypothetical protein
VVIITKVSSGKSFSAVGTAPMPERGSARLAVKTSQSGLKKERFLIGSSYQNRAVCKDQAKFGQEKWHNPGQSH